MADVALMPARSFGYVPTPAIVAPIEFTLPMERYRALGGHVSDAIPVGEIVAAFARSAKVEPWREENPWPAGRRFRGT